MAKEENKNPEKFRSWLLTINKKAYTDKINYANLYKYTTSRLNVVYMAYCEERGHGTEENEEGTEHLHLYIELANPITFSSLKKKFAGAHIEPRRGNPSEARNYIYKEGTPENLAKADTNIQPAVEFGDWDKYKNIIARGRATGATLSLNEKLEQYVMLYDSIEEVEDVDLWFAKTFKDPLERRFLAKKKQQLFNSCGEKIINPATGAEMVLYHRKVYYLYGESRTGKNFNINFKYGTDNVCMCNPAIEHCFDKYKGEKVLNIDEFRSNLQLQEMLILLDVYDNELTARYFNRGLLADTIIVSTNWALQDQYKNVQVTSVKDFAAFKNRFINGAWHMLYDYHTKKRFIYCVSKLSDYTGAARELCDFSEPPIYCDGENNIHITDAADYTAICYLIKVNKACTVENIEAEKNAPLPF